MARASARYDDRLVVVPVTGGVLRGLSPTPDRDEGAVALLVAALSVFLLGLTAIVVDLGFARDRTQQAQNAADAGALAAAQYLATRPDPQAPTQAEQDTARATAESYVAANGWPSAGTTVKFDLTRHVVTVQVPNQSSPTFFAGIVGSSPPAVSRGAGARWAEARSGDCTLCVFDDLAVQNADIRVEQGAVAIGGDLTIGSQGHLLATGPGGAITYQSTALNNVPADQLSPSPSQSSTSPPDPFEDVDLPVPNGTVKPSPSGYCQPGTYADVSECDSFAPGVFFLTGNTVFKHQGGNQKFLYAKDVVFYLVCSSGGMARECDPQGEPGGSIDIQGNINASFVAPGGGSTLAGFSIVADRHNTGQLLWIHGGATLTVTSGSIYLRSGHVRQNGNPAILVDNSMVIGSWEGEGNKDSFTVYGKDYGNPAPGTGLSDLVRLVK